MPSFAHVFNSTSRAYDASNSTLDIGTVLDIPTERVVGVSHTWPIAVTVERGELHGLVPGYDWRAGLPELADGIEAAVHLARSRGLAIDPTFDSNVL